MKNLEKLNFYEILEVSPHATQGEIREAYERAKRVYHRDSLAIYSLLDEDEIEEMARLIENAYEAIGNEKRRREYDGTIEGGLPRGAETEKAPFHGQPPLRGLPQLSGGTTGIPAERRESVEEMVSQPEFEFTGPALREIRERLGLDLKEIALRTKVSRTNLSFLEVEDFARLPALVYLKGFVSEYAKCLGIDARRVVKDYVDRYKQWERGTQTDSREPGRP